MLSRSHLFTAALALSGLPLFVACNASVSSGNFTKEEAAALHGIDENGGDICAAEGWYGDDVCDSFCVEADPDCPVSNCPDLTAEGVQVFGLPGEGVCETIDFACADGFVAFDSPECGCGCIPTAPPGPECGGIAGLGCAAGEFCDFPAGSFCGGDDSLGECKPIPDVCGEYYSPVCGCDGVTYGNDCEAHGAGASILHSGECEPTGTFCGGLAGVACGAGEFCNEDHSCGAADQGGICQPLPEACPDIWAPVCGCDGVTYGNACDAHASGASVAQEGECATPGNICGGDTLNTCGAGEFCNFSIDAMCGWADAVGHCEVVPEVCDQSYAPVCGCDGVTYANECIANGAGTAIVAVGECIQPF